MTDWGTPTPVQQGSWGVPSAPFDNNKSNGSFENNKSDGFGSNQWDDGKSAQPSKPTGGDELISCNACGSTDHTMNDCPNGDGNVLDAGGDDKCFGCGESGHKRSECPSAGEMTCRYCKKPDHLISDCPDKPPMVCDNCGAEGHFKRDCTEARKINRDHIADIPLDDAWNKIKQAVTKKDMDDAKEAVQEYIKASGTDMTYKDLQLGLISDNVGLWLIATERSLVNIFTNLDLQGNTGKKYSISFRFSDRPSRPREAEGWPNDREEILSRLDDAGEVVDSGLSLCYNCGEVGHITKACPQEKLERTDRPKISCYNCGADGHRVRDCPEPRVDKFACKNCGKSGHKVAECEEPPNPENVECRKCNEKGHFAKDCPQGGGRACRNCGQEGHIAKECDQRRNMDTVTCRNCEKTGHVSKECPEPPDWSKVQCSTCSEYGHTRVRCKQVPTETKDFNNDAGNDAGKDAGFNGSNDFTSNGASGGDNGNSGPSAVTYDAGGW